MNLNDIKTLIVGTIKQAFTNKKTLDKFDDTTGTLKYNGVPVNNTPVFVADDAPVGNIIAFMGNTAPQDYLICDGTEYNITDYPLLAQHILDEFGSYNHFGGDGTATFAVPDLRGEFLRGTGTATRDAGSGAEVGEHQDPTNISLVFPYVSSSKAYVVARYKSNSDYNGFPANTDKIHDNNGTLIESLTNQSIITRSNSSYSEYAYSSRPTNTSVLYCIKYQITQNNISKDIVNYSLDEQVIGSWINGKPLYEKTFVFDPPQATKYGTIVTSYISLSIENLEKIIYLNGYGINADSYTLPLPYDNTIFCIYYNYSKGLVINNGQPTYNDLKIYTTIRYTKTIDTENSFTLDMLSSITTLNTIASDEEVNEVIGGI